MKKYEFAFTTSSLRLKELIAVAKHHLEGTEIDYINELGHGNSKTGRKMYSELRKRLLNLTQEQIELLVNGDLITRRQLAFLATCKTYQLIQEFVIEVVREKYLTFDYELTEGNYRSFYRNKKETHPELEERTEQSEKKIKQVIFKILEQAGIIDNIRTKQIQPQLLDNRLIKAIKNENAEWLKIFFTSDMDVASMN